MITLLFSLLASALAGELHAGLPVTGIQGLGEPSFQTAATGWTAPLEGGGFVRVFVGKTEEDAHAWVEKITTQFSKPLPPYAGTFQGQDLLGDGVGVLVFRDGNVGFMVKSTTSAETWATTLRAALAPPRPWPAPPVLRQDGERWTVDAPGAAHVAFHGGKLVLDQGLVFSEPPHKLVSWDSFGRASTWEATPQP